MEACGFALKIDDGPRTDEIQLKPKIRKEIEDWLWSFVEEDISEADISGEDASYYEEINDSEFINPKWRALAALIHCDCWNENLPASPRQERFYQELNLIIDAQGETTPTARLIDSKSVSQESAFVLGLLFLRSPKVFAPALLELLEDQTEDEYDGRNNTFLSIARLLTGQKKMRDYSPRIDRALCLYAAQQQTNFMARPYWFEALVSYSPDALVHFNWVDYMADWNSLARGGLAQAVAESIPRLSGPEEQRKARASWRKF